MERQRLVFNFCILMLSLMFILPSTIHADGEAPVTLVCPHSQGYWANHPNEWSVTTLMLGTQFYSQAELLALLPGGGGEASTQLAIQLAATKLNLAAGTDPAPITSAMLQADAVLVQFSGKLPYQVEPSTPNGQALISLASILDTYNNGQMLAGCLATVMPTQTVTPNPSPTAVINPTAGPSPTPIITALPVNIIVEGPVQVVNVNVITIYDINIEIQPNDPILAQIHVGDFVRVEGSTITGTSAFIVSAVNIYILSTEVVISNDNTVVWQDNGNNCANPPPPWAPANGWRRRCQGVNSNIVVPGNGRGNGNNGRNGN